mgnify:FL=1|jgi:hypothetical protein|tara:strand:+ start:93 stop:596 length:504 start_codon:yes stop_codon:yes gene_type:complete
MGEFEKALEKYGKYVVQQARTRLTKGRNPYGTSNSSKKLYNSLKFNVKKNGIVFNMLDYGEYQDQGVRGKSSYYADETANSPFKYKNKIPPAKPFEKWIKQKGIQGRDKKTGRFISRQSLSYLIARSIYSKGIRATLFFTKPFEAGLDKFSDELVFGFIEDNLKLEE